MAINVQKMAVAGGIAGAFTGLLIGKVIMPILNSVGNLIPALSLKLAPATIEANIRASLTGINAGAANWLADLTGLTLPTNAFMPYIMAAVGGAILFVLGGYLAEALNILEGSPVRKTATIIWIGSLGVGFWLGNFVVPALDMTLVNMLIAFAINAAVLAYVYGLIDPHGKYGLVPF